MATMMKFSQDGHLHQKYRVLASRLLVLANCVAIGNVFDAT